MIHELASKRSGVSQALESLSSAFHSNKISLPHDFKRFVFLCGANQSHDTTSWRRQELSKFAVENLPNHKFFIAEKIFSVLKDHHGHKGNSLDIEHEISNFSDHIIIVLESPSAFTELGAFSHNNARNKLIVINNTQFKNQNSFINTGPLKALDEIDDKLSRVLWYPMANGVDQPDTIGDIFPQLKSSLTSAKPLSNSNDKKNFTGLLNPAMHFDKNSIRLIHDLVYIAQPLLYRELVEILKKIYGDMDFKKLNANLAMLIALDLITFTKTGEDSNKVYYSCTSNAPYLKYNKVNIFSILAAFKSLHLKKHPWRYAK